MVSVIAVAFVASVFCVGVVAVTEGVTTATAGLCGEAFVLPQSRCVLGGAPESVSAPGRLRMRDGPDADAVGLPLLLPRSRLVPRSRMRFARVALGGRGCGRVTWTTVSVTARSAVEMIAMHRARVIDIAISPFTETSSCPFTIPARAAAPSGTTSAMTSPPSVLLTSRPMGSNFCSLTATTLKRGFARSLQDRGAGDRDPEADDH